MPKKIGLKNGKNNLVKIYYLSLSFNILKDSFNLGNLLFKIASIFSNESLWILFSTSEQNSFFPFTILAAPQSSWLITINLLILCNFIEVDKLSKKVNCHFLNFLEVTPMAAPAIVNELYFPVNFFF